MAKLFSVASNSRHSRTLRNAPLRAVAVWAIAGALALHLPVRESAANPATVPAPAPYLAETISLASSRPSSAFAATLAWSELAAGASLVNHRSAIGAPPTLGAWEAPPLELTATLPVEPLASEGAMLARQMIALASLGLVGAGGLYSGLRGKSRRRSADPVATASATTAVVADAPAAKLADEADSAAPVVASAAESAREVSTETSHHGEALTVLGGVASPAAAVALPMHEGAESLSSATSSTSEPREDFQALGRKAEEFEAVFEQTPVIELIVDGRGVVRRANRAALQHFGWEGASAGALNLGQFIRCAQGQCAETGDCGAPAECESCSLRQAVDQSLQEGRVHRRVELNKALARQASPGQTLLASTSPLQIGDETVVLVCLEDVTAARLAEDRMLEQAALLAAAQEPICLLDLEGRIRFWNKGAELLFARAPVAVIDEEAAEILFGGPSPEWNEALNQLRRDGQWQGELHPVRRDGQRLTITARASLVRDTRGQPKSILLVAADLTEMKQLEQQFLRAQRLESLGTLACGVAHDLNNVLTPVSMVVDLLRPAIEGTPSERLLELLTSSAKRGADIIRQLLIVGRGFEGPRTELDLRYLIKEMAKMVGETFPRSIRVGLELEESLCPVIGDPTELHQVLLNLCVNARDAMAENGGSLTLLAANVELDTKAVRRLPQARPGRYVVLRVRDTGAGIPPEAMDRIFDPFFTTKPVGKGTGLGLATVQGIVRRHEGFIQVTSDLGRGAEFAVYLPAGQGTATAPAPEVELPARPVARTDRWVLVVDDEEAIREAIRGALESAGYRVVTAADGGEAISVFRRRHEEIEAVVMDMMMPFIDGPTTVGLLRRFKASLPVLAVSGLPSQREEAEKSMGNRVSFLQKPFTVPALLRHLHRLLEGDFPDPTVVRLRGQEAGEGVGGS